MNTQLQAPFAALEVFEPAKGLENQLLDALVTSGPFHSSTASGVCNERILQIPASGGNRGTAFLVLSQFVDQAAARQVAQQRREATRSLVVATPKVLHLNEVEHLAANWGWETGKSSNVETARSVQQLLDANFSVSFLKVGYVGQTAILSVFPAGTTLEQVRAEAKADPNLAGAAVFFDKAQKQFVVYSEFFRTPQVGPTRSASGRMAGLVLDHQPAIVVQNYESQ